MEQQAEPTAPECGTLVHDPVTGRVGEYRGVAGPYAMLRPVGGGREWQADPRRIRRAAPEERLRAEVKAANDRALRGSSVVPVPEWGRPPQPEPGCEACAQFVVRRQAARARFDWSGETDANVLLRQHRSQQHPEGSPERPLPPVSEL